MGDYDIYREKMWVGQSDGQGHYQIGTIDPTVNTCVAFDGEAARWLVQVPMMIRALRYSRESLLFCGHTDESPNMKELVRLLERGLSKEPWGTFVGEEVQDRYPKGKKAK